MGEAYKRAAQEIRSDVSFVHLLGRSLDDPNGQLLDALTKMDTSVSFKLFSAIKVTYHNPDGSNLFRVKPNGYKITMDDDSVVKIDGPEINTSIAKKIRKVYGVSSIDVYF